MEEWREGGERRLEGIWRSGGRAGRGEEGTAYLFHEFLPSIYIAPRAKR